MQVPFHDLPATLRMLILAPADDSISLSSSAGEKATKNSRDESRRDSVTKPKVARNELPWERRAAANNPNGVAAWWRPGDATPLGLKTVRTPTQGSSFLATLGCSPQSLRDCRTAGRSIVPRGSGLARNIRKAETPGAFRAVTLL